jgi:electron transfer DM13
MRKWLALAFLAGGVLGVVAGAGGMLIAFPFLFPPPVVAERAPDGAATAQVGTFQFDEQARGRDLVHWANGSGAVYRVDGKTVIHLGDDFKAGPGPNYWVYLNTGPVTDTASFKADKGRVRIAQIKSFTGGQSYVLPAGVEIGRFHTVSIWCESFSVYIGSAVLPQP